MIPLRFCRIGIDAELLEFVKFLYSCISQFFERRHENGYLISMTL